MITILRNASIFDGESANIARGDVVIEGDLIREVGPQSRVPDGAQVVECDGRYLMPGLIDCHFHAHSASMHVAVNDRMPPSLQVSHAARVLEGTLERGFTSVRDAGGGEIGLAMAIEQGLIRGPRLFFSGHALSQTGGHGDMRPAHEHDLCGCQGYAGTMTRVVDGVDAMRAAVRDELRKGAHQIKLFVSGGVLSPTDPIWMPQFSDDEIRAAVYEASTRRSYVMAHSHTDESALRCSLLGVRTIEHGTLIHRDDTAATLAARGTYVVPTMAIVDVLQKNVDRLRFSVEMKDKIHRIGDAMVRSIEVCERAGVKLGLGTDLLDHVFHPQQGGELALRGRISPAIDVLRTATSVNAEILQQSGRLGCIQPGALADLLVLEGDPLTNLGLFDTPLQNIPIVMKGGQFVRNSLT